MVMVSNSNFKLTILIAWCVLPLCMSQAVLHDEFNEGLENINISKQPANKDVVNDQLSLESVDNRNKYYEYIREDVSDYNMNGFDGELQQHFQPSEEVAVDENFHRSAEKHDKHNHIDTRDVSETAVSNPSENLNNNKHLAKSGISNNDIKVSVENLEKLYQQYLENTSGSAEKNKNQNQLVKRDVFKVAFSRPVGDHDNYNQLAKRDVSKVAFSRPVGDLDNYNQLAKRDVSKNHFSRPVYVLYDYNHLAKRNIPKNDF